MARLRAESGRCYTPSDAMTREQYALSIVKKRAGTVKAGD
jgi:hypothetical protein